MTQHKVTPDTLPDPTGFRYWLRRAMLALELKPAGYGPELGLGKNTLGNFLNGDPDRDIALGNAALIVADLQARAILGGVALEPLPRLSAEARVRRAGADA